MSKHPRIAFGLGDHVVIDNVHYAIIRGDDHGLLLQSHGDRITFKHSHDEIFEFYLKDRLTIVRGSIEKLPSGVRDNLDRTIDQMPHKTQVEIMRRHEYVRAADRYFARKLYPKRPEGFAKINKIVARYKRMLQRAQHPKSKGIPATEYVGGSTSRGWYWRWVNSGRQLIALAPCHDCKGKPDTEIDPLVVSYISKRVREDFLTRERPPVSLVIDLITADIEAYNKVNEIKLEPPSASTIRNWINRHVTEYEQVFYREGPKAAEQKFRHVHRTLPGLMPLQMVELDHQKLDVMSIWDIVTRGKDKRRKHVRTVRAWLTLAICTVTRMVVGWHISMEAPSWTSVMACLQMMMTVKRPEDYGATSDYPATGVPQTLKMDNGKELQSFSLKLMAADAGIAIEYCPRAKPHLKPYIERLNGTIARDFLADMPGKTFHNTAEKGDYDSEVRAAYTVEELKKRFGRYIIDVYHNREHAGLLNMSPLEKWRSMSGMGVRVPPKYADIRAMTGKVLHSKITNKGVQFKGLFYQDDDLQALRKTARQEGKDYTIKIDPLDISRIMVLDDINGKWISVKCNDPTVREGLTLVEHEEHVAISKAQTADKMRVPMERMRAARREMHDETKSRRIRDARATQRDLSVHRHEMEPVLDVTPTDEMPGQTYHDEAKKNRHAEMRQAEHAKSLGHVENHQAEPSSNDNHPIELNEMTLGESDHD